MKTSAKKKPSAAIDVDTLLGMGDVSEAAGDETDEELDVNGLLNASGSHSDSGEADDRPPLHRVIFQLLQQMPTEAFCRFVEAWKALAAMSSPKKPVPCGSGCTGSGMDWLVIKTITEALVLVENAHHSLCLVCRVHWIMVLFVCEYKSIMDSMPGDRREDWYYGSLGMQLGSGIKWQEAGVAEDLLMSGAVEQ